MYNGETNGSFSFESEDFYSNTEAYLNSDYRCRRTAFTLVDLPLRSAGLNDGYLWRIDSGELLDMIVAANQKIQEVHVVNKAGK